MHTFHSHFGQLYLHVDETLRQSLQVFRNHHPLKESEQKGVLWRYITLGKGDATVVFFPGAAGFYDIWWQQLLALENDFRLISFSCPSEDSLEGLRSGINAILLKERVNRFHFVGSSMGGYLAQYLAVTQPDRFISATLANTFVPTMPLLPMASLLRLAIRLLPLSGSLSIYRCYSRQRIVPSGESDALLEAYLMEVSYSGFQKHDLLARLDCASETFNPLQFGEQTFPILILDSGNDPLIPPSIRAALREMYPSAQRFQFDRGGHFPYLSQPKAYNAVLRTFLITST